MVTNKYIELLECEKLLELSGHIVDIIHHTDNYEPLTNDLEDTDKMKLLVDFW